jgi:hypothetical protein
MNAQDPSYIFKSLFRCRRMHQTCQGRYFQLLCQFLVLKWRPPPPFFTQPSSMPRNFYHPKNRYRPYSIRADSTTAEAWYKNVPELVYCPQPIHQPYSLFSNAMIPLNLAPPADTDNLFANIIVSVIVPIPISSHRVVLDSRCNR